MSRWGFLFDQTRCVGCNACQMACKDKNNLELGQFFRRVVTYETVKDGKTCADIGSRTVAASQGESAAYESGGDLCRDGDKVRETI